MLTAILRLPLPLLRTYCCSRQVKAMDRNPTTSFSGGRSYVRASAGGGVSYRSVMTTRSPVIGPTSSCGGAERPRSAPPGPSGVDRPTSGSVHHVPSSVIGDVRSSSDRQRTDMQVRSQWRIAMRWAGWAKSRSPGLPGSNI